ncbi:MAG TPA: hypothetical protein VI299_17755 [Polyangiales bacterium]
MDAATKPDEPGDAKDPSGSSAVKEKRAATYTMNAREGFNAAEVVNAAFGKRSFGSATPRKLEVVEPDGPSTSGGKRARQTIRLVALQGSAAPLMCGALDASQRVVELRSYATVCAQYEERFNQALDISGEEYARLCRDLQATLTAFRYTFNMESTEAASDKRVSLTRAVATESAAPPARAPMLNVILLAAFAVVAGGVALAILLR